MIRLFLITLLLLIGLKSTAFAQSQLQKGVDEIRFNVFLDNKPVGTHVFNLEPQGNKVLVKSNMQLEGKFWGLLPFKYTHQSQEQWQDGCLVSLQSQTLKRGKTINVSASSDASGLSIDSNDKTEVVSGCVKSFAYWDYSKLVGNQLLNTENGVLVNVEIKQMNNQSDKHKSLLIQSSEADINLEYSANGEWLSLKSKLEVGGLLHYIRQ
jgi:hypothetical protein